MLIFGSVTFIYSKVYTDLLLSRGGRSKGYVLQGSRFLGNSPKFQGSKRFLIIWRMGSQDVTQVANNYG